MNTPNTHCAHMHRVILNKCITVLKNAIWSDTCKERGRQKQKSGFWNQGSPEAAGECRSGKGLKGFLPRTFLRSVVLPPSQFWTLSSRTVSIRSLFRDTPWLGKSWGANGSPFPFIQHFTDTFQDSFNSVFCFLCFCQVKLSLVSILYPLEKAQNGKNVTIWIKLHQVETYSQWCEFLVLGLCQKHSTEW